MSCVLPAVTTSLPVTLVRHSPALPAQVLAFLDLQLCEVISWPFFWVMSSTAAIFPSLTPHHLQALAQCQLGTWQLLAPTAPRQKQLLLLIPSDMGQL